jgi:transcriptional regulator NrdR family protein
VPTGWRYKPQDEPTPRCPRCGCPDCQVSRRPSSDAPLPSGIATCSHCGTTFRFQEAAADPAVGPIAGDESDIPYRIVRERLRCPACGSTDFKTDTTRPEQPDGSVLRYHVCTRCGNRFSSLER